MLSVKQINQKISGIKRSTAAVRENIHTVLCSAAGHAFEHGDVTSFTKLYAATSGMNRRLIVKWVQEYGFAVFKSDGTFRLSRKAVNEADFGSGEQVAEYLTNESTPWYVKEESAAQIVKALDVAARIESLAAQLERAIESGRDVTINTMEIQKAGKHLTSALETVQRMRGTHVAEPANRASERASDAADAAWAEQQRALVA